MSTIEQAYKTNMTTLGEDLARREAVEIALDLIHASVGGGSGTGLRSQLDNLSDYADKIEAAVKKT